MPTLEELLLTIIESVGAPLVLKLIASRTPEDVVRAALDAEYAAARAAANVEAEKVL